MSQAIAAAAAKQVRRHLHCSIASLRGLSIACYRSKLKQVQRRYRTRRRPSSLEPGEIRLWILKDETTSSHPYDAPDPAFSGATLGEYVPETISQDDFAGTKVAGPSAQDLQDDSPAPPDGSEMLLPPTDSAKRSLSSDKTDSNLPPSLMESAEEKLDPRKRLTYHDFDAINKHAMDYKRMMPVYAADACIRGHPRLRRRNAIADLHTLHSTLVHIE